MERKIKHIYALQQYSYIEMYILRLYESTELYDEINRESYLVPTTIKKEKKFISEKLAELYVKYKGKEYDFYSIDKE